MEVTEIADTNLAPAFIRGRRRILGERSEDALVARVRAGDDLAFEALYDAYHGKLLTFCRHMLGSREEAEDVVQHTFLATYRRLRAGQEIAALKPWLYTVARNRCLSVTRGRREEIALEESAPATEGLAAEVDRRADLRMLVRDVQRLPPDQRAALVLFEVGDHSHQDIATVLGVRREKVKALVFQARQALMGWRTARDTPCGHVREQLATLSGGALGRGTLRRHVEQCEGCADYEAAVRRQRAALAIALPVAPAAGLRAAVLGSALGGSGVGAVAGVSVTAGGAGGLAAKLLVVAALVGGVGATGHVAGGESQPRHAASASRAQWVRAPVRAADRAPAATRRSVATPATTPKRGATKTKTQSKVHRTRPRASTAETHTTPAAGGKATAPGQLKAPGTPAQGKALGTGRVKARGAKPARVNAAPAGVKAKGPKTAKTAKTPKTPKTAETPKTPKTPKAAAPAPAATQTPPGLSAGGPPGQARKESDSAGKKS